MAQPLYNSGIDLHKRRSVIYTVDSKGNRIKEATIKSHPKALTAYFATLPGEHRAVVETTSGWYWVSDTHYSRLTHDKCFHIPGLLGTARLTERLGWLRISRL